MKSLKNEDKYLVFDVVEKREPVEEHKEKRDDVIKVKSQENNLCNNTE